MARRAAAAWRRAETAATASYREHRWRGNIAVSQWRGDAIDICVP
jgi:hypothetical protein